jgi:hypothetical protein
MMLGIGPVVMGRQFGGLPGMPLLQGRLTSVFSLSNRWLAVAVATARSFRLPLAP